MSKVLVLFSGGLDSTVILASLVHQRREVVALSFSYGQTHARELEAARRLVRHYGVEAHQEIEIGISVFGSAKLLGGNRTFEEVADTYVPARNTLFLAFAASVAEQLGIEEVFLGANADDAFGYPDCRDGFLRSFEASVRLGTTNPHFRINAPLLGLSKAQIYALARDLGVPVDLTWSCYFPVGDSPCGVCSACRQRPVV